MNGQRVILAAHRGEKKYHPENTMPAFEAALDTGVDMIETDIRMTKDGHLILMHDMSAKRTAGVERDICDMLLAEVKTLDVGSWMDEKFVGTTVPTVREFLEWISGTKLLVNWELKDYPADVGDRAAFECVDKLVALIREFGMEKRSMVNSFSNRILEYICTKWGHEFPVHGQGINKCRRAKDECQMQEEELFDWCCLYPNEQGRSPVEYKENFDYCREHGVISCVCIPDSMDTYGLALQYGCKMFTSNDIYTGAEVLKALGAR